MEIPGRGGRRAAGTFAPGPPIGDVIYRFGDFTLDTRCCELRRGAESRHLEPQEYAALCYLVEHRDRVVPREELLDQVWGHRFVTPATISTRIKALRQALDDDGAAQRVIRTVRGRGFRFVEDVRTEPAGASPAGDAPTAQQVRFCRAHDGARIAYAVTGSGPVLVKPANWLTHLEHDWNSPVWRHWLTEIGRTSTLIRYDERGCGLSDHDVDDFSFDAWVRDLETVVDAEGLERFPLLGMSQGCAVAVAYAMRHPERVSRLVLYGGYLCGRRRRTPEHDREAAILEDLIRVGWGKDSPAFRQVFGALFVPEGTPEQQQWYADLAHTMPMENALRVQRTVHTIDVREQAAALDVPTLVLHARGDAMIPFEAGRQLAAMIPRARFVPLDSRNHVLLAHEPAWQVFLGELRTFLAA